MDKKQKIEFLSKSEQCYEEELNGENDPKGSKRHFKAFDERRRALKAVNGDTVHTSANTGQIMFIDLLTPQSSPIYDFDSNKMRSHENLINFENTLSRPEPEPTTSGVSGNNNTSVQLPDYSEDDDDDLIIYKKTISNLHHDFLLSCRFRVEHGMNFTNNDSEKRQFHHNEYQQTRTTIRKTIEWTASLVRDANMCRNVLNRNSKETPLFKNQHFLRAVLYNHPNFQSFSEKLFPFMALPKDHH
ncbi:Protein CBG06705 [Caenorhabditis briggsae]|uniref:Protein CBG06705 n=1 Tax=Caenorhabditis briggsae TaxID=6238 RepID=A8X2W8_CAEBR|nr:Protein CBG06705 [Caenorhabditis briggsae]CAP26978.1 Protein CBG06705 [Caenorhabditis briggsae]